MEQKRSIERRNAWIAKQECCFIKRVPKDIKGQHNQKSVGYVVCWVWQLWKNQEGQDLVFMKAVRTAFYE